MRLRRSPGRCNPPIFTTVPGIGQILALVILYEIQTIARFPCVPDFVSYGRLVKGAKDSHGKRLGTSGKKIGTVQLRWAFAEAAVLFIRQSQSSPTSWGVPWTTCARGNTRLIGSTLAPRTR